MSQMICNILIRVMNPFIILGISDIKSAKIKQKGVVLPKRNTSLLENPSKFEETGEKSA